MSNSDHLVDRVYEWLLSQCSQRRFAKGQHLPAQPLAEELGVSASTIRKALLRAIDRGWVVQTDTGRPVIAVLPPRKKPSSVEFAPGENHFDIALRAVREKILRGSLSAGDSISARKLTEELQLSMPAVRQALEAIASAGLLHRQPRRGWRVTTLTVPELTDIFRLRLQLEPLIIRNAIQTITTEQLDELAEENSAMNRSLHEPSRYEARQADYHFHSTLAKVSGRRILAQTLDPLLQILFMNPGVRSARETFSEHAAILDSLRRRDLSGAVQHVRQHLRNSGSRYIKPETRRPAAG